jgi:hypothetical protein
MQVRQLRRHRRGVDLGRGDVAVQRVVRVPSVGVVAPGLWHSSRHFVPDPKPLRHHGPVDSQGRGPEQAYVVARAPGLLLPRGPVTVVRGVGGELVRAAELGENLQPIQLVRLEPVGEIIVERRIDHDTISAGPNTEADE